MLRIECSALIRIKNRFSQRAARARMMPIRVDNTLVHTQDRANRRGRLALR
jgi:hypothetical protein